MNYTPYARSKNHSQRQWRQRKRRMESFRTTISDDLPSLSFIDLETTNSSANDVKHRFSGETSFVHHDANPNSDHDISTDSSTNISTDANDWSFSSEFDTDCSTLLYAGSSMNVRQSSIELLRLTRRLNLWRKGVKQMLDSIVKLLRMVNRLPRTISGLLNAASFVEKKCLKFLCIEYLTELRSPQDRCCSQRCSLNNKHRLQSQVGELYHANISIQIKTVAEHYINIIKEYSNNYHLQTPDIPNGTIFKQLPTDGRRHLTLLLQTDGAPLVKVGGRSLWPVQANLLEIPLPLRDHYNSTMIFGAWLGSVHPSRDLLWRNIVNQIKVSLQVFFLRR
jgi:hypothetical protein